MFVNLSVVFNYGKPEILSKVEKLTRSQQFEVRSGYYLLTLSGSSGVGIRRSSMRNPFRTPNIRMSNVVAAAVADNCCCTCTRPGGDQCKVCAGEIFFSIFRTFVLDTICPLYERIINTFCQ